jgi:hypothetical protein
MLPQADNPWTLFEAAHLLNRAGFGGSPAAIKAFHAQGRTQAVDSLFTANDAPDAFPVPDWASDERLLADMRQRVSQRRESMQATRGLSPEEAEKRRREMFKDLQQENRLGSAGLVVPAHGDYRVPLA